MTLSFAPDAIEMWPLARLQPYARNAKAHGADQRNGLPCRHAEVDSAQHHGRPVETLAQATDDQIRLPLGRTFLRPKGG